MTDNTPLNSQITDAVTQSTLNTVGQSPVLAIATTQQAGAHAQALMSANANGRQQNAHLVAEAALAAAIRALWSGEPDSTSGKGAK